MLNPVICSWRRFRSPTVWDWPVPIPTNVTSQAQPILALHVGYHLFLRNNSLIYSLMLVGDASNIIHGPVARVIINVFRSLCIVGKVIYFSLNLKYCSWIFPVTRSVGVTLCGRMWNKSYFHRHFPCALSAAWAAATVRPCFTPNFLLVQCEEDEKFSVVSSCEADDPES